MPENAAMQQCSGKEKFVMFEHFVPVYDLLVAAEVAAQSSKLPSPLLRLRIRLARIS